jgi:hypothetical protein
MKKQVPAVILAIACIILLIAYVESNRTIDHLQNEIAQLIAANETSEPDLGNEISLIEPAVAEQTEPASPLVSVDTTEPAADETRSSGRLMMENIAKMMENPTMNKVMEASQRGAIAALYMDLIAYLNLNEEETKYFMDLVMYRQMKQVDLAMKMMSGGLTDDEKETLTAEVAAAADIVKEEMERFLNNPEDYAEWEFYEKTVGERMMLSQMEQDLAASDASLSDETYRELLGMMHDEKKNFDFTSDLGDSENMDMSSERFSRSNLQNFADDIQQLNEIISSKAQGILTPEQHAAFANSLKATTEMQLAQLEMAAQMFGGGNEGGDAK